MPSMIVIITSNPTEATLLVFISSINTETRLTENVGIYRVVGGLLGHNEKRKSVPIG